MADPLATGSSPDPSPPAVATPAATALVVADMVGVGVFTSLGFQVSAVPSGFGLLLLWAVGGLVALCGAVSYAELATMLPRSSGEYTYLGRAFGPAFGFMAGWLSATFGFAAPVALAAMAFGQYAKAFHPAAPALPLGLAVLWAVTAIRLRGGRFGQAFQVGATGVKLLLILAFLAAGLATGGGTPTRFAPAADDAARVFTSGFAVSLVFVMYAYSGWNAATYIAGDLVDPRTTLPRALFLGTGLVTLLYVALNAVFLSTTPLEELAGQIDVALVSGRHVFGAEGGRVVGALICLGLIPTISAMMWVGPGVTATMGGDVPLLRPLARRTRAGVPAAAVLLQGGVATLLLLTQSYEAVLEFIQFGLLLCSFLAVLALIRLRITEPDLPRPYRAWGYPVTPAIFLGVTLFMLVYLVAARPVQAMGGLGAMLLGLGLYLVARPRARRG